MRKRIKFDCSEIVEMLKRSDLDKTQLKRLQAVLMWSHGSSVVEVEQVTGFKPNTVQSLCSKYREYGAAALKSTYDGSHNRKLSFEKEAEILEKCQESAKQGCFIRVAELQAEFERIAGVHYHPHVFYRLLSRHNWRKVKPRGRHPNKSSDGAINASKKLTQKSDI